jgi:hypothetical protein
MKKAYILIAIFLVFFLLGCTGPMGDKSGSGITKSNNTLTKACTTDSNTLPSINFHDLGTNLYSNEVPVSFDLNLCDANKYGLALYYSQNVGQFGQLILDDTTIGDDAGIICNTNNLVTSCMDSWTSVSEGKMNMLAIQWGKVYSSNDGAKWNLVNNCELQFGEGYGFDTQSPTCSPCTAINDGTAVMSGDGQKIFCTFSSTYEGAVQFSFIGKSTDGGATWSVDHFDPKVEFGDLVTDNSGTYTSVIGKHEGAIKPSYVYSFTGSGSKETNWLSATTLQKEFPAHYWVALGMSGNGKYLTAAYSDNPSGGSNPIQGSYRTESNGFKDWNKINTIEGDLPLGDTPFGYGIAISYTGQYQLMEGGMFGTSISTNYGKNWAPPKVAPSHDYFDEIAVSGNGQYMARTTLADKSGINNDGTYGGVLYESSDYGNTWREVTTLKATHWLGKIFLSATGQHQVVVEKIDNQIHELKYFISNDFGKTWDEHTLKVPGEYGDEILVPEHLLANWSMSATKGTWIIEAKLYDKTTGTVVTTSTSKPVTIQ